jgi:hypothetical protein
MYICSKEKKNEHQLKLQVDRESDTKSHTNYTICKSSDEHLNKMPYTRVPAHKAMHNIMVRAYKTRAQLNQKWKP